MNKERRDARLIAEGREARRMGLGKHECPYHSRVEARELWLAGWDMKPVERNYDLIDTPQPQHRVEEF